MTEPDQTKGPTCQGEEPVARAVARWEQAGRSDSNQELLDKVNRQLTNTAWGTSKAAYMGVLLSELADRGLPLPGHEGGGEHVFTYMTRFEIRDGKVVGTSAAERHRMS